LGNYVWLAKGSITSKLYGVLEIENGVPEIDDAVLEIEDAVLEIEDAVLEIRHFDDGVVEKIVSRPPSSK
jgi:hypothetical protein